MKSGRKGELVFIDESFGLGYDLRRSGHILGETEDIMVIEVPMTRNESVKVACLVPKNFVVGLDSQY